MSDVLVQVNPGLYGSSGAAYECVGIKAAEKNRSKARMRKTDGGAFRITLPTRLSDPLKAAELFFHVARHEWAHISDYQKGGRRVLDFSVRSRGHFGRRPRWHNRPKEIRAEAACAKADVLGTVDRFAEQVLSLALAIGETYQGEI